ncbi:N-acetyltransferase domain-containing protein [Mycena indigotica]|uniref:N-acetyltransferase domain-containing protein n=1 Tax=Mycena indigotica TaxID=2126181 RepID=A0A8H6S2A6_9AGAR|nr:N-acetyltransferase domain-containing protein [Mycena indigotica]KAF7290741.1 N-acetyltransferase domain-containing protein [Mycena indigotica]
MLLLRCVVNQRKSEQEQRYALLPFMASMSAELQAWWTDAFLPQWEGFSEATLGSGVNHNSWTLQTLAVDPKYHRRGIARALLEPVVQTARREGGLLCVDTTVEENVAIYEKLGFQLAPKGKSNDGEARTVEECRHVFTGLTGAEVSVWILTSRRFE